MTDVQIEMLKDKHGEIFEIEVKEAHPDGSDETYYFKKPTRAIMAAATKMATADPMTGTETLIENCLVGGNRDLLEDVGVFLAVAEHMDALIGKRVGALKKS